jgi:hypothetical protein
MISPPASAGKLQAKALMLVKPPDMWVEPKLTHHLVDDHGLDLRG